ncbi:hypothetical protein HYQ46_009372 [Verticillium longisporum]|nr:hypothetical protein HYQ46_009372 [Verticillium longisporum]
MDLETRRPSFAALRCEAVLKWPALRDVVPSNVASIVSFPFEYALGNDQKQENTSTTPRTMPDDQFIHFSKRFLAIVHPRNPILDGNELLRHARLIEENGLQWDSASCLVLIACALGSYTLPWVKPSQIPHIVDAWQGSTVIEKDNRATAEAYYAAALKRVGPLGHFVRDIQCLFLASVKNAIPGTRRTAWCPISWVAD